MMDDIHSIHSGSGVTIAHDEKTNQIVVEFSGKPNRFVQDSLRQRGGMVRRNGTESKEWYCSFDADRWKKIHQLLNKEV